jgi:hypothetical protein
VEADDLKLDGNAAAGVLADIFGADLTLNWTVCDNCGEGNAVGALAAYVHGMGAVLRCPSCDNVMIRVSQVRGQFWLELRGARSLQIPQR